MSSPRGGGEKRENRIYLEWMQEGGGEKKKQTNKQKEAGINNCSSKEGEGGGVCFSLFLIYSLAVQAEEG